MFTIIDPKIISRVEIPEAYATSEELSRPQAARRHPQDGHPSNRVAKSGAPSRARSRAQTHAHSRLPYPQVSQGGTRTRTSSVSVPAQPRRDGEPTVELDELFGDFSPDWGLTPRATTDFYAWALGSKYRDSIVHSSRRSVNEMPPFCTRESTSTGKAKATIADKEAPAEEPTKSANGKRKDSVKKANAPRKMSRLNPITSFEDDEKVSVVADIKPRALTAIEKKMNREIAAVFCDNWKRMDVRLTVKYSPDTFKVSNPDLDFNAVHHGHKLMDLELPMQMLIDCIFDPRNFETEDVFNSQVHDDPLVEIFLDIARASILEEVRDYWRGLRKTDDDALRYQLDLLSKLYQREIVSPWKPVANLLKSWSYWRKSSVGLSQEEMKHLRPIIREDDRFFHYYNSSALKNDAMSKLKRLLTEKGLISEHERYLTKRLREVGKDVRAICEDREFVLLLDTEALEDLLELEADE